MVEDELSFYYLSGKSKFRFCSGDQHKVNKSIRRKRMSWAVISSLCSSLAIQSEALPEHIRGLFLPTIGKGRVFQLDHLVHWNGDFREIFGPLPYHANLAWVMAVQLPALLFEVFALNMAFNKGVHGRTIGLREVFGC